MIYTKKMQYIAYNYKFCITNVLKEVQILYIMCYNTIKKMLQNERGNTL